MTSSFFPHERSDHPALDGDLHAALTAGVRCRLDDTGVLAVTGADAVGFLNAQCSSNIAALQPGQAALTSYSDARGRVLAIPRVVVEPERLLLTLPAERADAIRQRLTKYVLRADVKIGDRTGMDVCFGIAGAGAAAPLEAIAGALPQDPWQARALPGGGMLVRAPGPCPRWMACGPAAAVDALWRALEGQVVDADSGPWRLLEIEAGMPEVYSATAERFVAQMLNLDRLGAVDFGKGCYPGQEVIARTHYLGRIKRRMHVVRSETGAPPAPGDPVYAAGETAGEVVDAAPHPSGGSLGLAVLRLDADHEALTLGGPEGPPAAAAPPYGLGDA